MCSIFFFKFNFIFKLYKIVLVLPNIKMNLPQVYMCFPSWTLLPPHTIPLGRPSALAPSIQYHASNLDWQLVSYMILYMFQCHSPKSSYPLPLQQSHLDCSIHQCLFCCLVHRVIVTIFLNSIYMRHLNSENSIYDCGNRRVQIEVHEIFHSGDWQRISYWQSSHFANVHSFYT